MQWKSTLLIFIISSRLYVLTYKTITGQKFLITKEEFNETIFLTIIFLPLIVQDIFFQKYVIQIYSINVEYIYAFIISLVGILRIIKSRNANTNKNSL
jgi:hypothetical protein